MRESRTWRLSPLFHRALSSCALCALACARPAEPGSPAIAGGEAGEERAPIPSPSPREAIAATPEPEPEPATPAARPAPEVTPLTIVDRPIRYDELRRELTREYRQIHEGGDPQDVLIEPKMIVLHHTGGSSADAAWRYFNRPRIESARATLAKAGAVNVGAQFVVDRDGTILRLMPENWHARHCVGFNHLAIGVENVGDGTRYPLTPAQVAANAALIRDLARRYPITHVIGHHEAAAMREHPYFREAVAGYRTRKGDPGPGFMAAVRAEIADLGLQGPPEPAK